MQRNPTKEQRQRAHVKNRIMERYGIECNKAIYRFLIGQIYTGDARFLKKQSNSKTVFEVYFCGEPIWVVYDRNTKEFRTALELGCDLREVDITGRTIPPRRCYSQRQ